jgi:hypothetical protein
LQKGCFLLYLLPVENIPTFLPYVVAGMLALFVCACLHIFLTYGRNKGASETDRETETPMADPVECLEKLRTLAVTQETYAHPSPLGRKGVARLTLRLQQALLFFPEEAATLKALASELEANYEDEGSRIMAMTRIHAWIREKLEKLSA